MIRSLARVLVLALGLSSQWLAAQVPIAATGMKQFDDWSPDKTGVADVSDLLQEAVDWSIQNSTTLYIAPGTYRVSRRILGKVFVGSSCGTHTGTQALIITGDAFNRPLIRLDDGATGFGSATITGALAVLEIQQEQSNSESCLFWSGIKNLEFDLGDNPGAVAIRFPSAQDSHIYNVKVYGEDFAAGFTGVPGRNAVTVNCEVIGGKYAFYINGTSLGASLFGLACRGQSVAALYLGIWRGAALTGLDISECHGAPVICRGTNGFQGNVVITDARIDMTDASKAAFDIASRALALHNVYVKGSDHLVSGTGVAWNADPPDAQWTRIDRFSHTPASVNGNPAFNLIDGARNNDAIRDFGYAAAAPDHFIAWHTPDRIYAFNSPGAVNVADFGAVANDGLDDRGAFQAAITASDIVFAPAGRYHLSAPLAPRDGSVLLGDPGKRSRLVPIDTPTTYTWLIDTPDIDGFVAIQDWAFDTPDQNYFGAVRWRTSRGFIVNVRNFLASGGSERNRHNFEFAGRAGGRFFGIADHGALYDGKTPSLGFRKVVIRATSNPISFYGLNLERGGNSGDTFQNPYLEAINARNIRVFGTKTETDGIVYSLSGCRNVFLSALMAHAHLPPEDPVVVEIKNGTTDVELNHVFCPYTEGLTMIDDESGDLAKRTDFIGVYRSGTFNPAVFDPPPGPDPAWKAIRLY